MPNPLSDAIQFLTKPGWPTPVFWLLLLGSIAIALYCWVWVPGQRRLPMVANWLFRLMIGCMWWQQTLWKLPPSYTDHPELPFGQSGLAHWMMIEGKSAAIGLQADFVNNLVLPHFYLFAPAVYGLEVLTAASLMLGLGVRLMGLIGFLQIVNLWLGLYNAYGEWPWTYFFLLVLQLIFAVHHYGRALGLDAVLVARTGENRQRLRLLELAA